MQESEEIKKQLIEEAGVYLETQNGLSPLAARIYALMILCPNTGYNFDEIVAKLKASKSSVSTNINLLLEGGEIEYYTKCGERKRFFRISKTYLRVTLKKKEKQVSEELKFLEKVTKYNCNHNKSKYENQKNYKNLYISYLERHKRNLNTTIKEMNLLEEKSN